VVQGLAGAVGHENREALPRWLYEVDKKEQKATAILSVALLIWPGRTSSKAATSKLQQVRSCLPCFRNLLNYRWLIEVATSVADRYR